MRTACVRREVMLSDASALGLLRCPEAMCTHHVIGVGTAAGF
jgi:hypothetical protein